MNLKILAVAVALALAPSLALAANPPQLIGDWKGILDIEGQKLTLVWHVGADQVVADSPDQGAIGLPGAAGVNGAAFTLGIPVANANFEGKLSEDGKTLSGVFYQGGASPSLTLSRISTTPTLPVIKAAPAEIRGDWQTEVNGAGGAVTLVFHLTDKPTADLPGAGTLPATVDKAGEEYSIAVAGVTFKGKLAPDGKTLGGAMSQLGQSRPMTLTRK